MELIISPDFLASLPTTILIEVLLVLDFTHSPKATVKDFMSSGVRFSFFLLPIVPRIPDIDLINGMLSTKIRQLLFKDY